MIIHKYDPEHLVKVYPGMFQSVFGFYQAHRRSDFVLVITDDDNREVFGFVSCLEHTPKEIHIQFGGLERKHRGMKSLAILRRILSRLHSTGYKWITMIVENTNAAMIRLALKEGFIIHGVRVATDHTTYVEMIKGDEQ